MKRVVHVWLYGGTVRFFRVDCWAGGKMWLFGQTRYTHREAAYAAAGLRMPQC